MLRLISLFFHLGLYLGACYQTVAPTMYGYLIGNRYSRNIFNSWISIILIRKVALFFILASKMNRIILPVIHGFNIDIPTNINVTPSNKRINIYQYKIRSAPFKNILSRMKGIKLSKQFNSNLKGKYRKYLSHSDILTNDILVFLFRRHNQAILLNKTGLISNWSTYYSIAHNKLFGTVIESKNTINTFLSKYTNIHNNNYFVNICIHLCLRVYYKLYRRMHLNLNIFKFKMNVFINEFKKFHLFIKLMFYLREFNKLPAVLFYLDPTERELSNISKYRICILSLVSSNYNTVGCINYPIPTNFGSYLSKIFYSYLFLNSYYLGRIMLILNAIK